MAATLFQYRHKLFEPTYVPSAPVVVPPQKNISDKITPKMWGVMGAVVISLVGSYIHTVILESHANKTQQAIIALKEQNDKMQATLAELKTLPAIESKAQVMGMQQVKSFTYLKVAPVVFEAPAISPETEMVTESPRQFNTGF